MSSSNPVPDEAQQAAPSFKEQLDHRAKLARDPNYGKEASQPSILEKVTEYVPAAKKILGSPKKDEEGSKVGSEEVKGPPERPLHDGNIEEFVRDQHRSKRGDNGQVIDG
ncbi:hypothetical protein BJ170DRAFT_124410 [Xylariales sp. AK1849]|nr:hypothetical protein BJ170DRAFT_124410 [Xylariales sp. AK1849]